MNLDAMIRCYEELTPASLGRFLDIYADNAYFKDPFNEVRGVEAIQRIFAHMFDQVEEPRFVVSERFVDDHSAMLIWEFRYVRKGRGKIEFIRGVSHLRFAEDGRVTYHRDYWDAAEELYEKIPLVGGLLRMLRRRISS